MIARSAALLLVLVGLAACGTPANRAPSPLHGTAASVSAFARVVATANTDTPTAAASPQPATGPQDMGPFVVTSSGVVQAENRAATVALHLEAGDSIQAPAGMRWELPPDVGVNSALFLSFLAIVGGHKLYVWITANGEQFEPGTGAAHRVVMAGDVLVEAFDKDDPHRNAVDHGIAIDATGHLFLSSDPVPVTAVINYYTGEQLALDGAERVGSLSTPQDGFIFTGCENYTCFLSYRGGTTVSVVAGALECGATVDVVTDSYRLQYQWLNTGWLPPSQGTATPPDCTSRAHIDAGEPLGTKFAHWLVRAFSLNGEPLSVVAAGDGTVYVGHIAATAHCGPCRGS